MSYYGPFSDGRYGSCVKALADQVGLTRSAVWRLCRRFEEHGVGSVRGLYPRQKQLIVRVEFPKEKFGRFHYARDS